MSEQSILGYVDNIVSKIDATDDQKVQIENELMRVFLDASEKTSLQEVKSNLCTPEQFAEVINKRLVKINDDEKSGVAYEHPRRPHHQRMVGEFMQERSNMNLKLLYIPLLQISSGTQRVIMPLVDDDDDDYEY